MDCSATFFEIIQPPQRIKFVPLFVEGPVGGGGCNFTHVSLSDGANLPLLAHINLDKVYSKSMNSIKIGS